MCRRRLVLCVAPFVVDESLRQAQKVLLVVGVAVAAIIIIVVAVFVSESETS